MILLIQIVKNIYLLLCKQVRIWNVGILVIESSLLKIHILAYNLEVGFRRSLAYICKLEYRSHQPHNPYWHRKPHRSRLLWIFDIPGKEVFELNNSSNH